MVNSLRDFSGVILHAFGQTILVKRIHSYLCLINAASGDISFHKNILVDLDGFFLPSRKARKARKYVGPTVDSKHNFGIA